MSNVNTYALVRQLASDELGQGECILSGNCSIRTDLYYWILLVEWTYLRSQNLCIKRNKLRIPSICACCLKGKFGNKLNNIITASGFLICISQARIITNEHEFSDTIHVPIDSLSNLLSTIISATVNIKILLLSHKVKILNIISSVLLDTTDPSALRIKFLSWSYLCGIKYSQFQQNKQKEGYPIQVRKYSLFLLFPATRAEMVTKTPPHNIVSLSGFVSTFNKFTYNYSALIQIKAMEKNIVYVPHE